MFACILFVCEDMSLSSNHTGASALTFSHLCLLAQCVPQAKFVILKLNYRDKEEKPADDLNINPLLASAQVIRLDLITNRRSSASRKKQIWRKGEGKLEYFYDYLNESSLLKIKKVLQEVQPDLIWAEHLISNYLVLQLAGSIPVVYSHHDFTWKINALRRKKGDWKRWILVRLMKNAEERLLGRVRHLVSGSGSELQQLVCKNPALHAGYFPTTYPSVNPVLSPAPKPNIVHLGTLLATANRIGLERFLQVCWPELAASDAHLTLSVIGKLEGEGNAGLQALLDQPRIRCLGFVADLTSVLRPYDIHVIPYEYDTGTRTRLPVALNYNQLLIAHKNACRGIEGLKHGENCLLAESLEEMTELIREVLQGRIDYKRIADQGKQLFGEQFTVEGQKKRMESFLSAIIEG